MNHSATPCVNGDLEIVSFGSKAVACSFRIVFNDHLIAIPKLWVLRPLRSLFTTKEADFEVAIPKVAIYVLTEVRQGGCGR